MSLTSSQFRSGALLPSSSMKTLPTTRLWLRRLRGAALDGTRPRAFLGGMPANGGGVARFRAQGLLVLRLGDDYGQEEFGGSRFRLGSCSLVTDRSKGVASRTIRSEGRSVNRTVQALGNWSWPGSTRTQTGERTIKRDRFQDEGDWRYSPEWWGTQGGGWGRSKGETVYETDSMMGNGVVSVTAHPASRPVGSKPSLERSHQAYGKNREKETSICLREEQKEAGDSVEDLGDDSSYKLLGYEWRVLRFNDVTRQSVAKVKALSTRSGEIVLLQQPDCIAFECVKSMISAGMAAVSLCGLDFKKVQQRRQKMRVLCVGMGGGSVPLFLANRLPGATVDVVDIDSAVIAAAVDSMGFPPTRAPTPSNGNGAVKATEVEALLWGNILDRITVYENDGESFVRDQLRKAATEIEPRKYDLVVVDAFDGKDVVPWSLCNRNGSFLRDLSSLLSDEHGAVVVNLHTDSAPPSLFERILGKHGPGFDPTLPQGRKVQDAALAYRDVLLQKASGSWPTLANKVGPPMEGNGFASPGHPPTEGNGHVFTGQPPIEGNGHAFTGQPPMQGNGHAFTGQPPMEGNGLAFTLSVAYQANITLVVCRGSLRREGGLDGLSELATEDRITEKLMSEADKVQDSLRIPFEMSKRVSRGFRIVR